jgi:hypothetical protein
VEWTEELGCRHQVSLNWLKLKDGVSVGDKDGKTNITVDSSLSSSISAAWLGMNRTLWMNQKFKKELPKESAYRHSLKEECEGLQVFLEVAGTIKDETHSKQNLDDQSRLLVEQLAKIKQAGLVEPFALLNRADNGIAQDYAGYPRPIGRRSVATSTNSWYLRRRPRLMRPQSSPCSPGTFYLLPPLLPASDGNLAQEGIE